MKADGCDFVILRIGDEKADCNGVRRADPTFPTLYKMAREAGLHVGALYGFCLWLTESFWKKELQMSSLIIQRMIV